MANIRIGGGSDGWLNEVEAAISGASASQAMNQALNERESKKAQRGPSDSTSTYKKLKERFFPADPAPMADPTEMVRQSLLALDLQRKMAKP